jgi:hypothetical protein
MVEFTLLEVHLDDATVDANATADAVTALPFSSVTTGEPDATESETDDIDGDATDDGDTESDSLAPLVALVGLVVLVIVLKKVLGTDDNE